MIRIYEPLYRAGQQQQEPLFMPLQLRQNDVEWREFRIFIDMFRDQRHRGPGLCGMFSPKFALKSRIPTRQFLEFCEANAEADVCFFNPFPQVRYVAYNVWNQGEPWHPGLASAAQGLLDAAGIPWRIDEVPRQGAASLAYSNFWVASESFWDAYVGGVLDPIARLLEQQPQHPAAQTVMVPTYHTDEAPYLPFVIERLFSTFLSLHPEVRSAAYLVEDVLPYCICPSERELVQRMKATVDAADSAGCYSADLIESLRETAWTNTRHAKHYFQTHPHPHSGRTVPAGASAPS